MITVKTGRTYAIQQTEDGRYHLYQDRTTAYLSDGRPAREESGEWWDLEDAIRVAESNEKVQLAWMITEDGKRSIEYFKGKSI
jgi:hypothetical protein